MTAPARVCKLELSPLPSDLPIRRTEECLKLRGCGPNVLRVSFAWILSTSVTISRRNLRIDDI